MKKIIFILFFIAAAYSFFYTPEVYLAADPSCLCVRLTNRTGSASVRGMIVAVNQSYNYSFTNCTGFDAIGVVFQNGIANGSPCWVAVWGIGYVKLESNTVVSNGNWIYSTTNGRANGGIR